jgi:hypothetical protein
MIRGVRVAGCKKIVSGERIADIREAGRLRLGVREAVDQPRRDYLFGFEVAKANWLISS